MKTKNAIILLISIALIIIAATIIFYSFYKVVDVVKIPYSFDVQDGIGIVADTDAVKFGGLNRGGGGKRFLRFHNQYDFPIKINIKFKGDKQEWISADPNGFYLQPDERTNTTLNARIPFDAEYGENFSGQVIVYYMR